jgi:hypothetical protein
MRFPLVERIDDEGNVSAPVMRVDRQISLSDQVQFLVHPEPEPGPGEIERGAIHLGKFHCVTVKSNARIHIGDVESHMVELSNLHSGKIGDLGTRRPQITSILPHRDLGIELDYNT